MPSEGRFHAEYGKSISLGKAFTKQPIVDTVYGG